MENTKFTTENTEKHGEKSKNKKQSLCASVTSVVKKESTRESEKK